ncbi:MAG: class I lanthipeptide [Saprospiraceae bacterium]
MKKLSLNPLTLDKQTIALLDTNQLQKVVGGKTINFIADSTGCGSGNSTCPSGAGSTGCGSGGSTCDFNKLKR